MRVKIGIVSIATALLAFFLNGGQPVVSTVSAILAIMSFGSGYSLGVCAIVLNLVNIVFFLPFLWTDANALNSFGFIGPYAKKGSLFLIFQFIAMVVLVTKQAMLKQRKLRKLQFKFNS